MFLDATKKFQIRNLWEKKMFMFNKGGCSRVGKKEDLLSGLGAQRRLPEAKPWRLVRKWQMEVERWREQCPPLGGEMYWFPQQYGEMLNLFTNLFLLFLLKMKKQTNLFCVPCASIWMTLNSTSINIPETITSLLKGVCSTPHPFKKTSLISQAELVRTPLPTVPLVLCMDVRDSFSWKAATNFLAIRTEMWN